MNADVPRRVVLDIDLSVLAGNFRRIREAVSPLGVVAVLKANAYGLGMRAIAGRLCDEGAAAIATAELAEALDAIEATGGRVPVLVLGTLLPDEVVPALEAGVRIPIASWSEAERVSAAARRLGVVARCHAALDTGMSRVGFRADEFIDAAPRVRALPGIELEGVYSHFPTANVPGDRATAAQVALVKDVVARLAADGCAIPVVHIANSDGVNNVADACRAPFTHVRTGINLHGSFDPVGNRRLNLKPVFTLRARLAQVRRVPAGSTIGYGRTYTAPRDMLVGTVAAGYADGLPLALSNRGSMLLHGVLCPVIGRICMDFTTIDLSQAADARPGDEVVCLGRQGDREISIDEWAALKGTHAYEILCSIGSRVKREYRN